MSTSLISSNPYQNSLVPPISPAACLTHLKNKRKNGHVTGTASVNAGNDVKGVLPEITKTQKKIKATACKICQCSTFIDAKEGKERGDASLTQVIIKKPDTAYKAYGKWIHKKCGAVIKVYEDIIFAYIHKNQVKDKQAAYKLAFEVFERVLKPVPIKFHLEDKEEASRIDLALEQSRFAVRQYANFEDLVISQHSLPAILTASKAT